jgi:hypothetical protein
LAQARNPEAAVTHAGESARQEKQESEPGCVPAAEDTFGCPLRDFQFPPDLTEKTVADDWQEMWRAIELAARLKRMTLILSGFDLEKDRCSMNLFSR